MTEADIPLLLVEDTPLLQTIVKSQLAPRFLRIDVASNGKEGLALFKEKRHPIVISDITMPEMNGLEMLEAILALEPETQTVLLTAASSTELFEDAFRLGVDGYISKPPKKEALARVMDKCAAAVLRSGKLDETALLLDHYRAAVDASSLVSKTNPAGIITYVNDTFCTLSGYTREELMGKPHSIVRHPEMPDSAFADMWSTIQAKKVWKGIVRNRAKDGGSYWVDATIFPILDKKGKITEYIAIRYDVTREEEYKQILEQQLDVSITGLNEQIYQLKEYEKAIDTSNAFSRTDQEGNFTYANETFRQLLGYGKEEISGLHYRDICPPETVEEIFPLIREEIGRGKTWNGVLTYRTKKGEALYFHSFFIPITDTSQEVIEVMNVHHDMTEIHQLNKEIEETQREVVFTMGAIGESRSKETGNHVKRVAEYSRVLALAAGLEEEEAELLKQASPMHDIGKVAIPDAILNKPGKFEPEEWEVMKTHAQIGHDLLRHSHRPILEAASIVALEHHERWDGNGYPRGLAGEAIHIYGRITAVADVFDALGSDRCYKKAWNDEKIFALFREERGRQFDPELVDLFFENLDALLEIRSRYADLF